MEHGVSKWRGVLPLNALYGQYGPFLREESGENRLWIPTMALSHSGLTLYDQCPSAFKRRYILKEAAPPKEPHPNAARGKAEHANFENYLISAAYDDDEMIGQWKPLLDDLRSHKAHAEREFGITKDWEPCAFDAEEAMLRGKIDADYITDTTAYVYEWKTGRKYPEHVNQRMLYALAIFVLFPEAEIVKVYTPYLDQNTTDEQEFFRGYLQTLKWIFERKVNKVQPPQPYLPRPSWRCPFCPYSKKHNGGRCSAG